MEYNWYVVQVLSGWEQKVKALIEKTIESEGMQDLVKQVLVPVESVSEVKSGKKTITKRKFFPGYILLEMNVTNDSWHFVAQTNGVIGFPGEGSEPIPLMEHEVEGIMSQIDGRKEKALPKVMYEIGETVKVTDGPFVNFDGVVDEINPDRGKLKVMVDIFGRSTPVELEYWQVEKI